MCEIGKAICHVEIKLLGYLQLSAKERRDRDIKNN